LIAEYILSKVNKYVLTNTYSYPIYMLSIEQLTALNTSISVPDNSFHDQGLLGGGKVTGEVFPRPYLVRGPIVTDYINEIMRCSNRTITLIQQSEKHSVDNFTVISF